MAPLRKATGGRLRLGSVGSGGFSTVGQMPDADRYPLRQLPGVGRRTVDQLLVVRQLSPVAHEAVAAHRDRDRP